jgi:hypothetical protein
MLRGIMLLKASGKSPSFVQQHWRHHAGAAQLAPAQDAQAQLLDAALISEVLGHDLELVKRK